MSNFKNIIVHYKDGTSKEDNANSVMARDENDFRGCPSRGLGECTAGAQFYQTAEPFA